MPKLLAPLFSLLILALLASLSRPARAQDGSHDPDCAVILCMAGGWPTAAECTDAYAYMLDRITDLPPKPPFDVCSMADGTGYGAYDLDYSIGSHQARNAYSCPAGGTLYFAFADTWNNVRVFCYAGVREVINSDGLCHKVYDGVTAATFRRLKADLTVEPGTEAEWTAPRTITETLVPAPESFEELCATPEDDTIVGGDEGEAPVGEGCVPAWSPPAQSFCDFAFPIENANSHRYDLSDPRMDRVSCGAGPDGAPAMRVRQYAGAEVSVMSIGRHEFPEAMKKSDVARLSADFYIPADYDWTYAGRLPLGINVGPWTSGGATGDRQSGSSIRLHVWPDNGGTLGIYSYNFDRTSSGAKGNAQKQWGQGVAKVTARLPRDEWITVTLELALDTPGADRDAASIHIHDSEGKLIGSDTSGKRLTYRRAGDTFGFTGAIFDDKLNSAKARSSSNKQYYVRNWQGQACEQR
jgi:hypothetical protein